MFAYFVLSVRKGGIFYAGLTFFKDKKILVGMIEHLIGQSGLVFGNSVVIGLWVDGICVWEAT